MKIDRIEISDSVLDINLKFYSILKSLVKIKLSYNQTSLLIKQLMVRNPSNVPEIRALITDFLVNIKSTIKRDHFENLLNTIDFDVDIKLFLIGLKLYILKDNFLAESKLKELLILEKLSSLDPLSLIYDQVSLRKPYMTRVNGALIVLYFFSKLKTEELNIISASAYDFILSLSQDIKSLEGLGLEINQVYMLIFSEVVNQSIISDSGVDYEERVLKVLRNTLPMSIAIKKVHDEKDLSTEFDFYFILNNRKIGIGAKRTLRERYKQFIKTVNMSRLDLMIEITLGIDLTYEKALAITKHGVHLFIADEVYKSRDDLIELEGVHSVISLTVKTLEKLAILNQKSMVVDLD